MISDVLKNKLLCELEKCKQMLVETIPRIKSDQKYVFIPIFLDGVIDRLRLNMNEKRFDQLDVCIAKDGIKGFAALRENAVYCSKIEIVTIDLPKDFGSESVI